jgi:hypothetical protein
VSRNFIYCCKEPIKKITKANKKSPLEIIELKKKENNNESEFDSSSDSDDDSSCVSNYSYIHTEPEIE